MNENLACRVFYHLVILFYILTVPSESWEDIFVKFLILVFFILLGFLYFCMIYDPVYDRVLTSPNHNLGLPGGSSGGFGGVNGPNMPNGPDGNGIVMGPHPSRDEDSSVTPLSSSLPIQSSAGNIPPQQIPVQQIPGQQTVYGSRTLPIPKQDNFIKTEFAKFSPEDHKYFHAQGIAVERVSIHD
jgi:hypothetical protein